MTASGPFRTFPAAPMMSALTADRKSAIRGPIRPL